MKAKLLFACGFLLVSARLLSAPIDLLSPDKRIKISVDLQNRLSYSVALNGSTLLSKSYLQLNLANQPLGEKAQLRKKSFTTVNTTSRPVVSLKNSTVTNHYNQLRLDFKNDFSVEFRAYNDGIAYRFITNKKDSVVVNSEDVHLQFAEPVETSYLETGSFKTSYEILYKRKDLGAVDKQKMSVLPILFDTKKGKLLFSEADLYDYPALFVKASSDQSIDATFPKAPLAFGPDGDRSLKIEKEAPYLAKTAGKRSFPWRFLVITDQDAQIAANQMVYKLSTPNQLKDTKWIKPGQVTWEWWHNAYVYGVDFKSGYNQDTYKYYIDFASKFGIPYIIMDEGWAKTTLNPFEPNPTINLQELIAYGKSKNVKIILWFTWLAVQNNFNVFETLEKWGIAGMKIDFMDRSDQWMVNYYTRVAKEAAKHHILVDFHGAFKPAGLEVAYPNVLSYEGVIGMEQNIGGGLATPKNNLFLPFLRNAVGPMDYTPGAMRSAHPKDYRPNWVNTMSIGTRGHQLAMYIVFESGLQMLADNPFNYLREPETTSFITSVPVTWDETRVLEAAVGDYIVTAKRKGTTWYVGGMTAEKAHEVVLPTDFLPKGVAYQITLLKDGVNADVQAMDYKKIVQPIKAGETIKLTMVPDGGFAARIEPAP
ncbi:glycoside hydrolase family 97 protein [Hymenobacter sp. GOD-10R]|uniref:glycoside hydrolase family 97 protein n=1 Tax=Hymenobacter sp. GOD-10R TaxID=3093922 RepID=UPI002D772DED|nr:glycoside hydrolase family 97 protein [Hymenobacter sp. GOD-10R]WRQ26363.1 glycoside hydrolase family 97 protein [Hymenobacter sp. GOD-10R]